jgi:hypothetical protein
MLLCLGVDPKIANCCLSHGNYKNMECSIEELLIALSDKLWKGKRDNLLELRLIDTIAEILGKTRWDIYIEMDKIFESIANNGLNRLKRIDI